MSDVTFHLSQISGLSPEECKQMSLDPETKMIMEDLGDGRQRHQVNFSKNFLNTVIIRIQDTKNLNMWTFWNFKHLASRFHSDTGIVCHSDVNLFCFVLCFFSPLPKNGSIKTSCWLSLVTWPALNLRALQGLILFSGNSAKFLQVVG